MAAGDILTIRSIVIERIHLLDEEADEYERLFRTNPPTNEQTQRLRSMLKEFQTFYQILMMTSHHYPEMYRIKQKLQRIKFAIGMLPAQSSIENEEER